MDSPAGIFIYQYPPVTVPLFAANFIVGVEKGGFIDEGNNQIGVDPKLGPITDNGGTTKWLSNAMAEAP